MDAHHVWANAKNEYIACAAIWNKNGKKYDWQPTGIDTGYVICGHRHVNCLETNLLIDPEFMDHEQNIVQGFLTSKNRFVTRKEALLIAIKEGQTKQVKEAITLYSEDLY